MRTGALAAALAAAALLPPGPPGVGVAVVAALVALTVAAAVPRSLDLALFGLPALVLVSMAVIRDAGWVVAADVALAIVLAAIAVGGVTATALVRPFVALRSAPALVPSPGPRALPALRGVLAGGLLVIPFAALFWTADAAFASAGRAIPVPGLGSLPAQVATFGLVLAGTIGLAGAPAVSITGPSLGLTRRCLPEWAVPLAALDLLFLGFVAVQAHVLFAGHDYVLRTTGLTYSEYARAGFWQLIAAAFLTLVVIAAAFGIAGPRSPRERRLLQSLLVLLGLSTLLVVASALHRLRLYESAFGLSRLRRAAEAVALWLGAVLLLVTVATAVERVRRHLPRIVLVVTALGLIAFSAADPDRLIAQRDVARWHETGRLDVAYLATLSADAAPAIARLPEPLRQRALASLAAKLGVGEPWSSANLSRAHARSLLTRLGLRSAGAALEAHRDPVA